MDELACWRSTTRCPLKGGRTIINIRPENVDAWLSPKPTDLDALYAIFDDKQHPFYEHRLAA